MAEVPAEKDGGQEGREEDYSHVGLGAATFFEAAAAEDEAEIETENAVQIPKSDMREYETCQNEEQDRRRFREDAHGEGEDQGEPERRA